MLSGNIADAQAFMAERPDLRRAIEYLRRLDLSSLRPGEVEIDARRLYANVIEGEGRGHAGPLEAHNDYIDVHFTVSGMEEIGYAPRRDCRLSRGGYNADGDVELFDDDVTQWKFNPPGGFQVFYPQDAHAPMGGHGEIRKVVVKIRL